MKTAQGPGVDPALVGTTPLPDGRMIVTYNEMPLYYWINDTQAGDTTGQGVGDVWYVVSPQGEVIGADGPAATQGSAVSEDEAEIEVATDPQLGEILVGKDGMTLYIFTSDTPNTVNCVDNCLVNWPPLVTEGDPQLGEGVDEDLIGTAELPDGRQVVTYNEMPLYYWANDAEPGDTTGQGVGGVWYVISPEGEVINP
jgi:predicted lipoprotein with Yx(FWY)xxD motif